MAENKLVGSLVLRTIDIDPSTERPIFYSNSLSIENEYGIYAANSAVITWKNVNIRTCLGELYYKYDKFNLKLTAVQIRHTGLLVRDGNYMIYMSGLPFSSNSGYNTRLGPTNQVSIGCVDVAHPFSSLVNGVTTSILSGLVPFNKPLQNTFDITVEFKNSSTLETNPLTPATVGYPEKTTMRLGHWSIICDIYGIDK